MDYLFAIGGVSISVDADGNALALGLESVSAQRTIAEDGVFLSRNAQMVRMIEPGGLDQDFPALETALGFFNPLAASVTYNLEQPPVYLRERSFPASQTIYDRTGTTRPIEAEDAWKLRIILEYGEGPFDEVEDDRNDEENILHSICWRFPDPYPAEYQDRLWWRAHQLRDFKNIDKAVLGIDERPPFILLTGFLGSGKTSFLQHFIEYQTQRSRFVAVIQNEIGEIGLDGKLLDYAVTEIDEGCVCCSLVGNVKRAVQGILESFSPDVIILETSGLANPKTCWTNWMNWRNWSDWMSSLPWLTLRMLKPALRVRYCL